MQFELTKLKQAMMAQVDRNNLTANNLSNIATTGFKKDQMFFHTLSDELDISKDMSKATRFDQGQLKQTGNTFDLAISGNGFFNIEMKSGETAFTRDGALHIDEEGILKNKANMPVLGEGGWINILSEFGTPNEVMITEKGEVFADGQLLDTIIISDFETPNALEKIGGSLFRADARAIEYQVDTPSIRQGFLESSNVNPATEMIELIEIQRNFEGIQRMVRALDDVYKKAATQVGQYRTTQ